MITISPNFGYLPWNARSLRGPYRSGIAHAAASLVPIGQAMKPKPTYFSGLDLGQVHEFTALAILEQTIVKSTTPAEYEYAVKFLQRFSPGTSYVDIAADVARSFAEGPLIGSRLMVDQTMVGRPVVEELRRAKIKAKISPLAITAGLHSNIECDVRMVPKQDLVSKMQILLQCRRLAIPSSLPTAALLARELANFKLKRPPSRDEVSEWREGQDDDLVFAVAIAVWRGEREPPPSTGKIAGVARPGFCSNGWPHSFW